MAAKALIVGASGGIGRGIAERLARDGWTILAHGRRQDALDATLDAVRAAGGDGMAHAAELADMRQVEELAAWASEHGPLDAVIYSAGGGRPVNTAPEAVPEWERTLATILHAPMRLTAGTLESVRQAEGRYLFICGMYAKIGMPRWAAHCAGRHGLEGFAKALFEEVREDGVGVTLLHPGFVYTQLSNTERLDPARMIQVGDIAEMAAMAVLMPNRACVVEMTVRPQRSPYRA